MTSDTNHIIAPALAEADYLAQLNTPQRNAVCATDGPVLVLAGAGTGKTRVLTTRISHLIHNRFAFPSQILAVTFTNKASKEMVDRVRKNLNQITSTPNDGMFEPIPHDPTAGMWLGTFHSIAARILRRHAELVGLTSTFTILDADDQLRLVKSLMKEQNVDDKMYPPKNIYATIQQWKDQGLVPSKVTSAHHKSPGSQIAHTIYKIYQERIMSLNACDFGDLLLHNLTLFQTLNEEGMPYILQEYQQRFRYILVDEYQDTNISQYLWLRLLAMGHKNICCVGDDDQSIYGWRGAEVGNILKFEQDYPNATTVKLEQNYRSTEHILGAASALIDHNHGRLGKTLWTSTKGGEKIRVKSVWDDSEEARYVGEEVEALQRNKILLKNMAVLIRAGFQTRSFEERFLTLGVPYKVVGGLRFYERLEIRDAIAYLRIVTQPRDDLAFERIINTPRRGIGKATLEQLHQTARANNTSLLEATRNLLSAGLLKGKAKTSLHALSEQITIWAQLATSLPPSDLAEQILTEANYIEMWKHDKSPEAGGRLENLTELFRALGEFETVSAFIEHIGLVMDTHDNAEEDMISIMTLHAAKGLEFDSVFLAGWEDGTFPHQRAIDESGNKGLEEERRLAYVGITRAERLLTITYAANRRIYGQWQSSIPSRFLQELAEEHIEIIDGGPSMSSSQSPSLMQKNMDSLFEDAYQRITPQASTFSMPKKPAQNRPHNNPKVTQQDYSKFNKPKATSTHPQANIRRGGKFAGKKVNHVKFGEGKVITSNGDTLDILFEKAGRKKIMKDFVKFV